MAEPIEPGASAAEAACRRLEGANRGQSESTGRCAASPQRNGLEQVMARDGPAPYAGRPSFLLAPPAPERAGAPAWTTECARASGSPQAPVERLRRLRGRKDLDAPRRPSRDSASVTLDSQRRLAEGLNWGLGDVGPYLRCNHLIPGRSAVCALSRRFDRIQVSAAALARNRHGLAGCVPTARSCKDVACKPLIPIRNPRRPKARPRTRP